jgi:hypothetical protein
MPPAAPVEVKEALLWIPVSDIDTSSALQSHSASDSVSRRLIHYFPARLRVFVVMFQSPLFHILMFLLFVTKSSQMSVVFGFRNTFAIIRRIKF